MTVEVKEQDREVSYLKTQTLDGSRVTPTSCSAGDREKLAQSLDTLLDFCEIYGFRRAYNGHNWNTKKTLDQWCLCAAECGWIKFLKYKFCAFFSNYLETELPTKPFGMLDNPSKLAGGSLGRWINKIMASEEAFGFADGILRLKKGLPRPGPDALSKAIESTKKMLTTAHPCPPSDYLSRENLRSELRRTVREVFSGHRMTEKHLHKPYAPSIRANYTDSRSAFGTLGTLVDSGILKGAFPGIVSDPVQGPNTSRSDNTHWLYEGAVVENGDEEIVEEGRVPYKLVNSFKENISLIYTEVYESARARAMEEKADVKLVALPEALKVRVISKGPALTYFVLKPVQKFLHKIMRQKRVFALIGQTATADFISNVIAPRPRPEEEGDYLFHSLDYESATDLLDPEVSSVIVDEICNTVGIPDDLRILFHKSLTGHTVEGEKQVWGQLMGSITSFIVLCLANATVCRAAYEQSTSSTVRLGACPLVVNGDDGLVYGPPSFSEIWKSIAASAGLKPSVGKVYSHPVYLNINSTSFEYDDGEIRQCPYVNMGLVAGLQRSGGKVDAIQEETDTDGHAMSMGARHHHLLDNCPVHLRLAVHQLFMKRNRSALESVHVPWFVPELLGGVGLQPVYDVVGSGDDIDDWKRIQVAGPSHLESVGMQLVRSGFYDGLKPAKVPTSQPILCRNIWSTRLGYPSKRMWLSQADEGFLDVSTFYLLPRLVMIQKPFSRDRLRSNERAWKSIIGVAKCFDALGGAGLETLNIIT